MRFVGQHHIMNQLYDILRSLYVSERGANFLLRGPSGYGKTTLALSICTYLAGNFPNFELYNADSKPFELQKRVIFIDEVHSMKNHESLYHEMDKAFSGREVIANSHVFVFATNADSVLPEAFTNRCMQFVFTEYDTEELVLIARESAEFNASDESFQLIVDAGSRNPRIIKGLVYKMDMYFQANPQINPQTANFKDILESVYDIKDGLDTLARRYLEVLRDVGGIASITLLKNIMHVDQNTLINSIEPVLIQKGLLQITQKGRKLL